MINSRLSIALTTLLITCRLAEFANCEIVAHWKFDELSGQAAQASVGPWAGVLSGGATFAPGAGVSGGALSLARSTNSFVNMGTILPFDAGDFSVQAWVKTTPGDTSDLFVLSRHESGYTNGYILAVNGINGFEHSDNKAGFYASAHGANVFFSQTPVNDGAWHQLVGTFRDGGLAEIFVDGGPSENNRSGLNVTSNSSPFVIGGITFFNGPQGLFTGLIDDVQVYDHALTSEQVEFLFANPGQALPEPGALMLSLFVVAGLRKIQIACRHPYCR